MKVEKFYTVSKLEGLVGDINEVLFNINESLESLEGYDWREIMSHVPDSDFLSKDVMRAICNIRDNLSELQRGHW